MAHGEGSTGYSSDVLEAGRMAASQRKVPVTASIMTTSRGAKENEGKDETQSLYLKQGGSRGIGGVGYLTQVHHSTQKGMAVYALEWCYQKLRASGRKSYKSIVNVGGARRSHYLCVCVCVCVCFGHKTTCVFALVFSVFLVT